MDDFAKYEQMKSQAASPGQAYSQAMADGLDKIAAIRMLRRVYGLSLAQAKEATGSADSWSTRQAVAPGSMVYWEGSSTAEGFYLVQARVERIVGDRAELSHARKFRIINDGLVEVSADPPSPMRIDWLERPLTGRFEELLKFVGHLSNIAVPVGS